MMTTKTFRNLAFVCFMLAAVSALGTTASASGCSWTDCFSSWYEEEQQWVEGCESSAIGTLGCVGECDGGFGACDDALSFCDDACGGWGSEVEYFWCQDEQVEPPFDPVVFHCRCLECIWIE